MSDNSMDWEEVGRLELGQRGLHKLMFDTQIDV